MLDGCGDISQLLDIPGSRGIESFGSFYQDQRGEDVLHIHDLKARHGTKGLGTRFMEDVCAKADEMGFMITLSLATKGDYKDRGSDWKTTTSSSRLERFYRRFGFKNNCKRGRYDLRGSMHRSPKPRPVRRLP